MEDWGDGPKPSWGIGDKGNFETELEAETAVVERLSKYADGSFAMWIRKTYVRVYVSPNAQK